MELFLNCRIFNDKSMPTAMQRLGGLTEMNDANTSEKQKPKLSGAADTVSQRLREYYLAIQNEGIPDKFLDLLEKLDKAEEAARK